MTYQHISKFISDLITDLISNFGIASMLNHTINFVIKLRFMVWFNMEATPKFDFKSDIKFDIGINPTTWIGQHSTYLEWKKTLIIFGQKIVRC